jgi:hypothetical protein
VEVEPVVGSRTDEDQAARARWRRRNGHGTLKGQRVVAGECPRTEARARNRGRPQITLDEEGAKGCNARLACERSNNQVQRVQTCIGGGS